MPSETSKAEYLREYRIKNKERIAAYERNHYQENKQRIAARSKRHYQTNKERILQRTNAYRKAHLEYYHQKIHEWYQKNKNQHQVNTNNRKFLIRHKEWYEMIRQGICNGISTTKLSPKKQERWWKYLHLLCKRKGTEHIT
jgi:hypothetical protein